MPEWLIPFIVVDLAVDRDLLKSVLAGSTRSHRVVKSGDLSEAMKRVA